MSRIARLKLAFAAGILVMLANAVIPYQTIAWMSHAERSLDHSETIIAAANQALSLLKDVETGHRGFILTGKDEYLQPYEEGLQEIRPQLARMETLLADQPAARHRLDVLQQQVEGKIREMDRSLGVRRAQGLEPAAAIVAEGKGKALMDGIRVTVREITLAESNRLADLNLEQRRRSTVATYALALITLLDLLVLGIVYYLVFRTISGHAATERVLHETGERLKSGMAALEARNREMEILHGMTDALQSATTTQESYGLVAKFGAQLFPDNPGTIYVFHPSRDMLEAVCDWGAPHDRSDLFEPDDCWALRRSQPHVMNDPLRDLVCPHAGSPAPLPYLCIPLNALGETMGLICMQGGRGPGQPVGIGEATRNTALTLAEQASLSLANMRMREVMRHQSITDALTGLNNRRYLDETLRRELLRAARKKQSVALIIVDADHFKRFNDTYGHDAGDLVLRALANLMKEHARGSDIVCRYGGEEFVMVMPEMELATAVERATKLCEAARLLDVQYGGQHLGPVTISAGVAVAPDHANASEGLLHAADAALYAAKGSGRDRVVAAEHSKAEA
jgi:diguanylate cyclase (GGDEF)-like protein